MKTLLLALALASSAAYGWGELGHQLVARTAVRLLAMHPLVEEARKRDGAKIALFLEAFERRSFMLGHVANIPDIYWRAYDDATTDFVHATNPPTHWINLDLISGKMPLRYEEARKRFDGDFFARVGTNPWRAQQLADLYRRALDEYPEGKCDATREALTYAGLLSHFIGDAAQPYHTTKDHDGVETGERGIHWYFENHLVNALQDELPGQVFGQARDFLVAPATRQGVARLRAAAKAAYPDADPAHDVAALTFALLDESRSELGEVRRLDKTYALATREEAKRGCAPKNDPAEPCRRRPTAIYRGRTVAGWNQALIVERIGMAAAVTADLWARRYLDSKRPALCWTWSYALKPSFVSPIDPKCLGYAVEREAGAKSSAPCLKFN